MAVHEPESREEEEAGSGFLEDLDVRLSDYGLEDYVVLAFFWVLAGVVFAQFFSRYVLNDSIAWTEEAARYLLVTVAFLGAAMPVRRNTHIHVEFFYRYLPPRASRVLSALVDIVRILFLAEATWLTWKISKLMQNQKMTAIDLSMSVLYDVVLAGFVIMTLRSAQVAYRHWKRGYSDLDIRIKPTTTA